MDHKSFRTKAELERANAELARVLRQFLPAAEAAVLQPARQLAAELRSDHQLDAAFQHIRRLAATIPLPPCNLWLKTRLADPRFRARFLRFQKHQSAEDYKPEIALACLLANGSPLGLKATLSKLHKQFTGLYMDRANLNRLLHRAGLVSNRGGRTGRPPKK